MAFSVSRLVLDGLHSWFVAPPKGTGGTVSARYCYSVFLRHRIIAARHGLRHTPECVVELGPGDSLGIGLMAVLTGSERYYAVDAVRHASPAGNLAVFEGLVDLLRSRAAIPADGDCAEIRPRIEDHAFPADLLSEARLDAALAPTRLDTIRKALQGDLTHGMVQYLAPWGEVNAIAAHSADWVLSQAVMEHVDQPGVTYNEAARCLRPDGVMSHQIDFRSHDTAPEWDGHWKYPRWLWRVMRGNRPWFINRLPCSAHVRLLEAAGFDIVERITEKLPSETAGLRLAAEFVSLSQDDRHTAGAMLVAKRSAA